jgi:chromosomal replication initiation ATPase DnaA
MTKQQKIKLIKNTCCDAMGTKWKDVNTAKRTDALVKTRHLIMFFLWRYTRLGLKEIGQEFAHPFKTSSVIYCRKACNNLIHTNGEFWLLVNRIDLSIFSNGIEPTRLTFKQNKQ